MNGIVTMCNNQTYNSFHKEIFHLVKPVQSLVGEYRPISQILMRPTFSRLFFIVVFEYVG